MRGRVIQINKDQQVEIPAGLIRSPDEPSVLFSYINEYHAYSGMPGGSDERKNLQLKIASTVCKNLPELNTISAKISYNLNEFFCEAAPKIVDGLEWDFN